jgi:hypothetical protein
MRISINFWSPSCPRVVSPFDISTIAAKTTLFVVSKSLYLFVYRALDKFVTKARI